MTGTARTCHGVSHEHDRFGKYNTAIRGTYRSRR